MTYENIEKIIDDIHSTLGFEGLKVNKQTTEILKKLFKEDISINEANALVMKNISLEKKEAIENNKAYEGNQSRHCYPKSHVYINKFDIKNSDLLDEVEGNLTALKLAELYIHPPEPIINLDHLKEMHYHLFKDLYPFAGEIRREEISKGATLFCKAAYIETSLADLFLEIKGKGYFKKREINEITEGIIYTMGEMNMIHPFREGNGRLIRAFVNNIAIHNGFILHWSKTNAAEILKAIIKTVNFDYSNLRRIIIKVIEAREL